MSSDSVGPIRVDGSDEDPESMLTPLQVEELPAELGKGEKYLLLFGPESTPTTVRVPETLVKLGDKEYFLSNTSEGLVTFTVHK